MKRLLLDTHVFLWWLSSKHYQLLGEATRNAIMSKRNEVYISAASGWEISIKKTLRKLKAPDDIDSIVESEGFSRLPITLFHGEQAGQLPAHHNDPFDRMLIAQAQAEGLTIVTNDSKFPVYGIQLMHAGS